MIRVYLDWNVMVQMKAGSLPDLREVFSNKDVFLIPYSTSHIGDILSSNNEEDDAQKKRIEKDLDFISSLTQNYCLSNNGKQVVLDITDPHSLFQQRLDNEDLLDDFGLGKIEELFNVEGMPKGLGDMFISAMKSIPIDESFQVALQNPESKETLQKLFPDLGENPTMEDFFRSFGKMFKNLNEEEGYKDLREITQDGLGINRDKIFNDDDPYDIIDNTHSKLGFKFDEYVDHSKYAPDWFNRITNEYLKLDMHGYQEDKVEVKPNKRKQTFANTTEDGAHAAFASMCDFFITNDNRSIKKTKMVYERLDINTLVVKPQEFLDLFTDSLRLNLQIVEQLMRTVLDIIKTQKYAEANVDGRIHRTFHLNFYIFDFFNRLNVIMGDEENKPTFMFGRNSPTNSSGTYVFETKILIKKLNTFFGIEDEEFGKVSDDELKGQTWSGLVWELGNYSFRLLSHNGYFQLYINFE